MTASTEPSAILSHLHRTDGSATFSQNGYTIIGAVNGPIEVQRRDELSEEAAIDVVVRPAAGVGGTRERHLESIIHSTLRQLILINHFPRTLIQVTLQVTNTPGNDTTSSKLNQASANLTILPALLQTSILALLSATLPLAMTMASTLLIISGDDLNRKILQNPSPMDIEKAASVHVLAFTSQGDLLVAESEGHFSLQEWNDVFTDAHKICLGSTAQENADTMDDGQEEDMMAFVKSTLKEKLEADLKWRT